MNLTIEIPPELEARIIKAAESAAREAAINAVSQAETRHRFMTSDEVMEYYEISRATLTRWQNKGLNYTKGSPNKYRQEQITAFLIKQQQ